MAGYQRGLPREGRQPLNAAEARRILDYDPETGILRWKPRVEHAQWSSRWAGKVAGNVNATGHLGVHIHSKMYLAHRVIWLIQTGEWPPLQLDHINGNRLDNSFRNLRLATPLQNARNRKISPLNRCGLKGVVPHQGKWRARIHVSGKRIHLGTFATPEEAHEAYRLASPAYHGEFGRPQ